MTLGFPVFEVFDERVIVPESVNIGNECIFFEKVFEIDVLKFFVRNGKHESIIT